jgi:hypothetical protein
MSCTPPTMRTEIFTPFKTVFMSKQYNLTCVATPYEHRCFYFFFSLRNQKLEFARYIHQLRGQSRSEREGVRRANKRGFLRLFGGIPSLSCKQNLEFTLHVHKQDSFEFVWRCTGATTHNQLRLFTSQPWWNEAESAALERMVSAVGLLLINE